MRSNYGYPPQTRRGSNLGVALLFFLVGAYFLNLSLGFFPIPATLTANKIYLQAINFVAAAFIILGGLKFLFPGRSQAY